jgi:hypothetical protein
MLGFPPGQMRFYASAAGDIRYNLGKVGFELPAEQPDRHLRYT